jgi:crotonobetainyl-CoA:carnitine CoA-transferase CaiB-like acyl-CoA transferase
MTRIAGLRFQSYAVHALAGQSRDFLMPIDSTAPLAGIRVLDASRVLAGPFCGQMLGDLGAEVIKIEHPEKPDETRTWGPPFTGSLSAYYLSCNRNKRALTLDLGQEEGARVFHELARQSDVFLENFRAASAQRLGLDPARLHGVNSRLIVCSISGFGRTGPLSELPGYDFAIQALSGLMSITGPPEGPPYKVGVALTDIITGLYAAVAVLACLKAREKSGHGYHIDLALLDCAVAAQVNVAQAFLTSGEVPPRQGNAHLQIVPYQLFETLDNWLVLAVGNDGQWRHFCRVADRPDWADSPRFHSNELRVRHRDELVPLIAEVMKSRNTADWQRALSQVGVPNAPVWNYSQLFAHDQAKSRGLQVKVRDHSGNELDLVGSPFHIEGTSLPRPTVPPEVGGDTGQVLRDLGFSEERIAELQRQRVI